MALHNHSGNVWSDEQQNLVRHFSLFTLYLVPCKHTECCCCCWWWCYCSYYYEVLNIWRSASRKFWNGNSSWQCAFVYTLELRNNDLVRNVLATLFSYMYLMILQGVGFVLGMHSYSVTQRKIYLHTYYLHVYCSLHTYLIFSDLVHLKMRNYLILNTCSNLWIFCNSIPDNAVGPTKSSELRTDEWS